MSTTKESGRIVAHTTPFQMEIKKQGAQKIANAELNLKGAGKERNTVAPFSSRISVDVEIKLRFQISPA